MIEHPEADNMFKGYGPLATFKAKVDMVFLLRLFPHEKIYRDLDKIPDIRNYFAHGHKELSFSDQQIKDRISAFNILGL